MQLRRLPVPSAILALALVCSSLAGCATTESSKAAEHTSAKKAKRLAKAKSETPKNYSLFKGKELDRALLRRGQKAMASPALDSY